ncbi:MAG TPA: hypothetical protein PL041_05415 [Melioribacteraceae bacterium]|nr:hypothetical protein [Melioribacteraceae bacterium]
MGSFFGVLGHLTEDEKIKLSKFADNLKVIEIPNGYLFIRLKDPNIYCKQELNKGFVISGLGIESTSEGFNNVNLANWEKYVYYPFNISFPDGHYCGISWINNKTYFFNDILGIKHLYTKNDDSKYYFSNSLFTLQQITNSFKLTQNEFFAAWFLNAKINYKPLIEGIERINGINEFIGVNLTEHVEHEWIPTFNAKVNSNNFDVVLKKLMLFGLNRFQKFSLGLTAGLDSRLLLSYLLKSGRGNWVTHTFGDENLPDIIYSKNISTTLGFKHNIYNYELPKKEDLISTLANYVSFTNISIPVSETIQFGMHNHFADLNTITVDGSYGETYRRQMLNRLLIVGKEALYNKDFTQISKHLKSSRPNIFNTELRSKIEESVINSIAEIYELMPSLADISLENWLDIFAIKIKMPNTTAYSQHCLDTICTAVTIFLQPTLLKIGISLPLEDRINGRMFRELINKNAPTLKTFPLVKNNYSYPYNLGNKASYIYTKIKSKIFKQYNWTLNAKILDLSKEYLIDSINSVNFKSDELLNKNLITNSIYGYYKGEKEENKTVTEWFLTYHLFTNFGR